MQIKNIYQYPLAIKIFLLATSVEIMFYKGEETSSQLIFAENLHDQAVENISASGQGSSPISAILFFLFYSICAHHIIKGYQKSFLNSLKENWPITMIYILMPISIFWNENFLQIFNSTTHLVGFMLISYVGATYYFDKYENLIRDLALVFGINILIQISYVLLFSQNQYSSERWSGLTSNPNSFGMFSAIAFWANFCTFVLRVDWKRPLTLIFILLSLLGLYTSLSMTSLISCLISTFYFLVSYRYKIKPMKFLIVIILSVTLIFLSILNLDGQIFSFESLNVERSSDLSGRLGIWTLAIDLITMKPILGWGYDRNFNVINFSELPTFHFHNGYIDLIIKGGILVLILFIIGIFKFFKNNSLLTVNQRLLSTSYFLLIAIYNLTEVSFFSEKSPMWLIFLLFLFSSNRFVKINKLLK